MHTNLLFNHLQGAAKIEGNMIFSIVKMKRKQMKCTVFNNDAVV